MTYGIIYHAFDVTNGKSYVGQTIRSFRERQSEHYDFGGKRVGSRKFISALKKRPFQFVWTILTKCSSKEDLDAAEIYWIGFFDSIRNGYNLREGGCNGRASEETRRLMSQAKKGKRLSKEWCANIAKAKIGHHHPEAAKLKMSLSQKRRRQFERDNGEILL